MGQGAVTGNGCFQSEKTVDLAQPKQAFLAASAAVSMAGAHQGRNPRTGAAVVVAKKALPFFKTGKDMRERLNR